MSLFGKFFEVFNISMATYAAFRDKPAWAAFFIGFAILWKLDRVRPEGCQKGKG